MHAPAAAGKGAPRSALSNLIAVISLLGLIAVLVSAAAAGASGGGATLTHSSARPQQQQQQQPQWMPRTLAAWRQQLEHLQAAHDAEKEQEQQRAAPPARTRATAPDAADDDNPLVEFVEPGVRVPLASALNLTRWEALPLGAPGDGAALAALPTADAEGCPRGSPAGVRLLVAVLSSHGERGAAKRASIRATWARAALPPLGLAADAVKVVFVLAQPPPLARGGDGDGAGAASNNAATTHAAVSALAAEARAHGDLLIVPGVDSYRNLPSKVLRVLCYALGGRCRYTHVAKVDDDVYLRLGRLVALLGGARDVALGDDGTAAAIAGSPPALPLPPLPLPRQRLYLGARAGADNRGADNRPWWPTRPEAYPNAKWALSRDELPDEAVPCNVRYAAGPAYVLSADAAAHAVRLAVGYGGVPPVWSNSSSSGADASGGGNAPTATAARAPAWWGRLPWEDVMVGALLQGYAPLLHAPAFRSPHQACPAWTLAKHLDVEAPGMMYAIGADDVVVGADDVVVGDGGGGGGGGGNGSGGSGGGGGSWAGGGAVRCTERAFGEYDRDAWRRWRAARVRGAGTVV